MGKLNIIDFDNFILEGEFEKIKKPENAIIDENSLQVAIEDYKRNFVKNGNALGKLNDGFLVMPTIDGEQVVEEQKIPCFMVIDIWWNNERKSLFGKVILLNTPDANKVKQSLRQGVDCYISQGDIESYPVKDKDTSQILLKIQKINGFDMSIMSFHSF